MEHSTINKAEKLPENHYLVESDSNKGSISNTIIIDYILVLDSLIQVLIKAQMPPPLLLRGRLIIYS